MNDNVKITKLCNALRPNAVAKDITVAIDGFGISINPTIDNYKSKHGGLWVGGRMFVTDKEIIFNENSMNKALHKSDNGFSINLEEVNLVERVFGFISGILVITTKDSVHKIRCMGAKRVAVQINEIINS